MKNKKLFSVLNIVAVCALTTGFSINAYAQMYRSVLPDGTVVYTDRPPANAKSSTPLSASTGNTDLGAGNRIDLARLPADIRTAYSNYPVTLYTSNDCEGCNIARSYLNGRGIPFNEFTVSSKKDFDTIKERLSTDASSFPILTVGSKKMTGYNNQDWDNYLTAAGFPKTSKLPASYINPAPRPLTTSTPEEKAQEAKEEATKQPPVNTRPSDWGNSNSSDEPQIKF